MSKETEKISRRDFIGAALGTAGLSAIGWSVYSIAREKGVIGQERELTDEDLTRFYREENEILETATPKITEPPTSQATKEAVNTPEPSPTPEQKNGLFFGGEIDFLNPSKPIEMLVELKNGKRLWIPPFNSYNNEDVDSFEGNTQVLDKDGNEIFKAGDNTVVAQRSFYPLSQDKYIRLFHLWMHSGEERGEKLEATELQYLVEQRQAWEENPGFKRTPEETERIIQELIIGSKVIIKQDDAGMVAKIVGAARIPPSEVTSYIVNVNKRLDYIKENHPNSNFDKLGSYNEVAGIWTCGERLTGEEKFENRPKARQSRLAFAIAPVNSQ